MRLIPVSEPIRIFIGLDGREIDAWHVAVHTIIKHATAPVSITPISLNNLQGFFWRKREKTWSTDFAVSRFLVPALAKYQGWALFMDCDMLVRANIAELWAKRDYRYAVQVVKHQYVPKTSSKAGGAQSKYMCKNWSSLMLMNCEKCKELTVDYVNNAPGLDLHQFRWLPSESQIGELNKSWNHLVGEYEPNSGAKIAHFTLGLPSETGYESQEFAGEWLKAGMEIMK